MSHNWKLCVCLLVPSISKTVAHGPNWSAEVPTATMAISYSLMTRGKLQFCSLVLGPKDRVHVDNPRRFPGFAASQAFAYRSKRKISASAKWRSCPRGQGSAPQGGQRKALSCVMYRYGGFSKIVVAEMTIEDNKNTTAHIVPVMAKLLSSVVKLWSFLDNLRFVAAERLQHLEKLALSYQEVQHSDISQQTISKSWPQGVLKCLGWEVWDGENMDLLLIESGNENMELQGIMTWWCWCGRVEGVFECVGWQAVVCRFWHLAPTRSACKIESTKSLKFTCFPSPETSPFLNHIDQVVHSFVFFRLLGTLKPGSISFKEVLMHYRPEHPVLNGLNLEILAGQKVRTDENQYKQWDVTWGDF